MSVRASPVSRRGLPRRWLTGACLTGVFCVFCTVGTPSTSAMDLTLDTMPDGLGTVEAPGPLPDIPAYRAQYLAQAYGQRLVVELRLQPEAAFSRLSLHAEVQGLLRLLGRFEWQQDVLFRSTPQGLQILQRSSREQTPMRQRSERFLFDWENGTFSSDLDGRSVPSQPLPADFLLLDVLTSLHWTMQLLQAGQLTEAAPLTVTLFERGQLREYVLQRQGRSTLSTTLGSQAAVLVLREDAQRGITYRGWFAPDLHYLPVQFDYATNDDVLELKLQKIHWETQ